MRRSSEVLVLIFILPTGSCNIAATTGLLFPERLQKLVATESDIGQC